MAGSVVNILQGVATNLATNVITDVMNQPPPPPPPQPPEVEIRLPTSEPTEPPPTPSPQPEPEKTKQSYKPSEAEKEALLMLTKLLVNLVRKWRKKRRRRKRIKKEIAAQEEALRVAQKALEEAQKKAKEDAQKARDEKETSQKSTEMSHCGNVLEKIVPPQVAELVNARMNELKIKVSELQSSLTDLVKKHNTQENAECFGYWLSIFMAIKTTGEGGQKVEELKNYLQEVSNIFDNFSEDELEHVECRNMMIELCQSFKILSGYKVIRFYEPHAGLYIRNKLYESIEQCIEVFDRSCATRLFTDIGLITSGCHPASLVLSNLVDVSRTVTDENLTMKQKTANIATSFTATGVGWQSSAIGAFYGGMYGGPFGALFGGVLFAFGGSSAVNYTVNLVGN